MTRTPPDPSASTAAVFLQLHDFLSSSFVKERLSNSLAFDSFVRNQASVGESTKKTRVDFSRGVRSQLRTMLCTPQEQGAPFPLLESHPVFTFPPVPEELVLRKLRLRVHKSTGDSLLCNQLLKRSAPFQARLYHLPLQPLPVNLLLSERLETCQSHPSLQKPRLPIRSL